MYVYIFFLSLGQNFNMSLFGGQIYTHKGLCSVCAVWERPQLAGQRQIFLILLKQAGNKAAASQLSSHCKLQHIAWPASAGAPSCCLFPPPALLVFVDLPCPFHTCSCWPIWPTSVAFMKPFAQVLPSVCHILPLLNRHSFGLVWTRSPMLASSLVYLYMHMSDKQTEGPLFVITGQQNSGTAKKLPVSPRGIWPTKSFA